MQELWFQTKAPDTYVVYTGKVHNFRLEIWTLDIIVTVTINFRSSGWRQDYMTLSWCWRNGEDIPAGDISQWIHTLLREYSIRYHSVDIPASKRDMRCRSSSWRKEYDAVVLLTKRSRSSGLRGDYLKTRSAFGEELQIFQLEKRLRSNVVCLKNKSRSTGLRKNYLTQRNMFDEEVQIFRLDKRVPDAVILLTKRYKYSVWR